MAGSQVAALTKEGEGDDTSFIRTEDVVCLLCSSGDGMKRGYLAADGFGSEFCYLEAEAREEEACELWKCTFQLEEALSVHAMSTYRQKKQRQVQRKILMYGQAILLRHQGTKKLLRCLSSSPANDKLAHHIGFTEKPGMVDGNCWFLVCPSSKQRSDGEKVRAGDAILLRNVSNERYLSAQLSHLQNVESDAQKHSSMVQASFQQSVWTLHIVCSGSAREAASGYVNGTDVVHLQHRHGAEDCLSVAARSCDKNVTADRTCSEVCYQCPLKAPLRTLWRVELFKMKFGGGFTEWRQPFRLRHMVTGKFLGVKVVHRTDGSCVGGREGRGGEEGEGLKGKIEKRHTVALLEPSEATFRASAFCFSDATTAATVQSTPASTVSSKSPSREMMGEPQVKFGDSEVFLVHLDTDKLVGCPVSERSHHLLRERNKRRVVMQREVHQGQTFTVTRASEEQAKAAGVAQLMESTMRNYVQKVLYSNSCEYTSEHLSHNLLHLLTDLMHYFHLPPSSSHPPSSSSSSASYSHDSWQNELSLLRERQELFQKQGMLLLTLNIITETGLKCRVRCSPTATLIHHKLYELLAAMIRGNRKNCSEFATGRWLKVFIDQLNMPEFTHDVLEVIHCLLTDSPEVLNIITKEHIQVIVNLLLSRGRDKVVMRLLSSLCVCSEVAMRDKQRLIHQHLLDCRDLLIQTSLHDHVHCLHPGLYVGTHEGSAMQQKWYYEAEITQLPPQHAEKHFHVRVGWAHATLFRSRPSSNSFLTTSGGIGDDLYSIAFDGEHFWFGGESFNSRPNKRRLERQETISTSPVPPTDQETQGRIRVGDVIGCYLDLAAQEVWFTKNGRAVPGVLRFSHLNDTITPAMSMSSCVGMVLSFGKSLGPFSHNPPSEFSGLFEAATPGHEQVKLSPFISLGTSEDLAVSGPISMASYEGFVPAPIDTGGMTLPDPLRSIRDQLAYNLHEVWAKNKIEAGYRFAEVRNDDQKLHPLLCPISSLSPEDSQYDYTMAYETLATLLVLGYHIIPPDSRHTELEYQQLDEERYQQSNGYLPRPLNLDSVRVEENLMSLVTRLAENCHNVWAAGRIKQGWTYGRSNDGDCKKNPSLVPYDKLDASTKKSNWDSAHDTVRTVLALGCPITPPSTLSSDPLSLTVHQLSNLPREYSESQVKTRTFRGQKCFTVTSGKWYYEVKVQTEGMMRVGWATPSFPAHLSLGDDEHSYAFDGYLVCKWHNGRESFGQRWGPGDVIGCLLDLDAGQLAFSLNGDLLQDPLGSSVAFEGVSRVPLVPAITLAAGEKAQLNFGRSEEALRSDYSLLGYRALCSPSALHFNIPLWYSSPHESLELISPSHPRLLVSRRPSELLPNSRSRSVLSVSCRDWDYSKSAQTECLRLNTGVFVTPEMTESPHCPNGPHIHPRPGPFSPVPTTDTDSWMPFSDCSSPKKNIVSYTTVLPAGQDPKTVFVGWTSAQFCYVASQFQTSSVWNGDSVYGQGLECFDHHCAGSSSDPIARVKYSHSSAYLVCVKQLLTGFSDQNLSVSLRVVCTLDLSSGHMTFSAAMPGQEVSPEATASQKTTFNVKRRCKLFPTVISTPSTERVIDFDFTPDLCCNSISSTLTPPSSGAKLSHCPARFKLMVLTPSQWVQQPFQKVPYTAMSTAEGAIKIHSYKEPTYLAYATLPEEDQVMNLLELSEHKDLLQFHICSLQAYCAVVSHCNIGVGKKVGKILDPEQLLYLLRRRGIDFSLRAAYIDLFNTLYLEPEVNNKLITRGEFIIPLSDCLHPIPLFPPPPEPIRRSGFRLATTPLDQALMNQATVGHNIRSSFLQESVERSKRCKTSSCLKEMVFYYLEKLLTTKFYKGILLPRVSCSEVIVPVLTLLDNLLVIGAVQEQSDLSKLLTLLEPQMFAPRGTPFSEGLLSPQVAVEEPIKLALCSILQHLCDCQVQHRVESTVAFAASYVESLQKDQRARYERNFAKKPKEFRTSPQKQIEAMLSFKRGVLYSECPTPADLQKALREFHSDLLRHCGVDQTNTPTANAMADKSLKEKLKALAQLLHGALFSNEEGARREKGEGGRETSLQQLIMSTMIQWAQQPIHSSELIEQIFTLLYRQCDEINEVVQALQKTYVIDVVKDGEEKMNFNIPAFRRALGSLRLLQKVGMGREEEQVLKDSLNIISHSDVFYCHPHLLRSLGVHLTVLGLMRSYLGISVAGLEEHSFLTARRKMKMAMSKEGLPAPVEWCCKFLCNFARVSSDNQRALFDHISYLLEHSEKNAGCMTCRGCTPMDVAMATIRDNGELCLALDDAHFRHVVSLLVTTTTSVTGGGVSVEQGGGGGEEGREVPARMASTGSLICEWAPNGGEKCLDFLQCAVWADGEQIQENAYVIVRLLIHHPECLGPALTGEAIGLCHVYEDALDHMFDTPQFGSSRASPRDSTDVGSAFPLRGSLSRGETVVFPDSSPPHVNLNNRSTSYTNLNLMNTQLVLSFYTSLVRLLAYCAPAKQVMVDKPANGNGAGSTNGLSGTTSDSNSNTTSGNNGGTSNRCTADNTMKKSGSERTRNILSNLVSIEDVRGILSLPFARDGRQGIVPAHKEAAVLFLSRVYGVTEPQLLRGLLTDAFLPDIKTALKIATSEEQCHPLSSPLLRYLCLSVFPLLTQCTALFPQILTHLHVIDNLLICCCRLGSTCNLTAGQLANLTAFLIAALRCTHPAAVQRFMPKIIADIPSLLPHSIMHMEFLSSHYTYFARYYESGQRGVGLASEEEKVWSALVIYRLLDTLSIRLPHEKLERSCVACLQAVSCTIVPDALLPSQSQLSTMYQSSAVWYDPRPVSIARVTVLRPELKQFVVDYASFSHDCWVFEQQSAGWTYGVEYCEKNHHHPNLRPFKSLPPEVKAEYMTPIEETVKYLIVRGFFLSKVRAVDFSGIPLRTKTLCLRRRKRKDGTEEKVYEPEVLDLSKVSTPVKLLAMAEMIAEDAHDRWASSLKKTSPDYGSHPFFQPYELVDDVIKEERRMYALDLMRYMRISGFELLRTGKVVTSFAQSRQSSMCQEKFSLQFFDKFLQLLSKNLDPVYYSRVLFPTLASYLNHNRRYFVGGQRLGHSASREEKVSVFLLFCRVMDYAHTHQSQLFSSVHRRESKLTLTKQLTMKTINPPEDPSNEKGALFREIHSLIESVVWSLDLRAIVVGSGSVAEQCPSIITFFQQSLETIQSAKQEMAQQREIKTNSHLQSYGLSLLIPTLTVLFNHVGYHDVSRLLIQGTVLNHCRAIFQSLIEMATGITPVFVGTSPIVVIGRCLGAFSRAYPDPFLEKQLFGFDLDSLLSQLDIASSQGSTAGNVLYVVDIVIPVLSNYISKWSNSTILETSTRDRIDYTLSQILSLVAAHFTLPMKSVCWFVRIIDSSLTLAQKCSLHLLPSHLLPMCVGLGERAMALWHAEQLITSHIATSSNAEMDGIIEELVSDYTVLVRDLTTTLFFLLVFLKFHSEELRIVGKMTSNEGQTKGHGFSREGMMSNVNALFMAVADIFHCWFSSPHLRRVFLAGTQWLAQHSIIKGCTAVLCPLKETRNSRTCNPLMAALNLLLPIVNQHLSCSDRDLVSCCADKLAEKGASYEDVKSELIQQLNVQQVKAQSQEHLGHRLVRSISHSFISQSYSVEERAVQIVGLARVRHRMKLVDKPGGSSARSKWKQLFTRRKKKAVMACFLAVPYFDISKHRAINMFLQTYCQQWLDPTDGHTHSALSSELLDHQDYLATHYSSTLPPDYHDPLSQLFTMMKRRATSGENFDHELFTAYPNMLSKIITGFTEDERSSSDENVTVAYQSYYKRRAELYVRQNRLAKRGAASMVLLVITAAKGENSAVIHSILKLGIALLEEGNSLIQGEMLTELRAMDVGYLASIARFMTGCSVLDWNAHERYQKSEVMQSSTSIAMTKVLANSAFTEDLFRFLQLLCEGHNADFQNYLRTQAGNTTTVNIITCTVDYLLRLQESISDFYWHYSEQETIDLLGRDSLLKAFRVAKQVFRTLTEYVQGPCVLNQETLAHSRLLDAVSGFLHVFAILQRKLYRDTSQMELLRELLGLQEEMFILLLSMLEGSAMSSQLGKLMVDMLVESEQWILDIMAFFSIFVKLKDTTTAKAFKEYDLNKDGMISYKEFEMAMEAQQRYSKEEIAYLMDCADTNRDGLLDYMEFTERFHQPAENIGFHLCVLIVHLSEHLPQEKRLCQFKTSPQGRELMDHFEQGMGSIEIQGKSGRIERVYFDVKQSRLAQWNETQIKESRKNFLHSVEMGSHKKKLDGFVSFCEDTIFEMDYADKISGAEQHSRESRAFQHRLRHTKALQTPPRPISHQLFEKVRVFWAKYRPLHKVLYVLTIVWSLLMTILLPPLRSLANRGRTKLQSILPHLPLRGPALPRSTQSTTPISSSTLTGSGSGSRLGTLAQRKALHLSIPPQPATNQAQHEKQTPPPTTNPPNLPRTRSSSSLLAVPKRKEPQGRRHSVSASVLRGGLSFMLPQQAQAPLTPPNGTFSVHNLTLRYNRAHMRRPSSDNLLGSPQGDQSLVTGVAEESYVPKITLSTRGWQAFIARHYYCLNNLKLLVTFLINVVLLSFTVQSFTHEQKAALNNGVCTAAPLPSPANSSPSSRSSDPHTTSLLCDKEFQLVWNPLYLQLLSALHFLLSLVLIFSYWNLKVPLIIFKHEKEIARRLEAKQMWVWSRPKSLGIAKLWEWGITEWREWLRDRWDGIVISAPSFPRNYWDKQVKDRVCYQFEGTNREVVARRFGMETQCQFEAHSKWKDVCMAVHSLGDLRYFVWVLGTVLSDMMVLYNVLYCGLSFLGLRQNSFYFSIHLLDLVMNFKLLRTVLYSVLHNGKQLIMTVLMTCVVIYLYTVIAFNFFRKFYVQLNHTVGERVNTCDGMAKCFIYHIDKGLRAGGGIGDVLQSASGDPDEILRLFFDVTFFFFVIVILLAIIQGLIIDAFGELRDREESITTDMKNRCFICGLPKTEFDHIAHGFDNHVTREHNTAHYMFFLLYLIRKQESEFSGQESYVWEMYLKRRWDFFPVGDSFQAQEERRLADTKTKPKGTSHPINSRAHS